MKTIPILSVLVLLLLMSSCAPAVPCDNSGGGDYGFLFGLLHGIILPFAIIGKIINSEIGIYAVNNTGFWYWIGYIIGVGLWWGGANRARR